MTTGSTDEYDEADMAVLAGGDDAALNRLMHRHGEKLFHYLVRLTQNEAEADDLSQETFVRVYQHRKNFKLESKFTTWLYTIATNLARSFLKKRARHGEVSLEVDKESKSDAVPEALRDTHASPSEVLQSDERAKAVQKAVAALPEELRVPLVLAEYEDKSHDEIAEIMGCSSKAVEMRIYRARHALRLTLGKLLETL